MFRCRDWWLGRHANLQLAAGVEFSTCTILVERNRRHSHCCRDGVWCFHSHPVITPSSTSSSLRTLTSHAQFFTRLHQQIPTTSTSTTEQLPQLQNCTTVVVVWTAIHHKVHPPRVSSIVTFPFREEHSTIPTAEQSKTPTFISHYTSESLFLPGTLVWNVLTGNNHPF